MMKNDAEAYQKLIAAGISFVSYRMRSRKELSSFINRRAYAIGIRDTHLLNNVFSRLEELGYADDKRFARMWITERMKNKPKGVWLLARELEAKGIAGEIIDDVIESELGNQQGSTEGTSEEKLAHRAIQKKLVFWKKYPIMEQKKKIYGFLARRGFPSHVIFRIIDEITRG